MHETSTLNRVKTALKMEGVVLTAWPSVQCCTSVRRHEVAGRWRDTWQKCAWGRFLCRVFPPDHCRDQLQEQQQQQQDMIHEFSLYNLKTDQCTNTELHAHIWLHSDLGHKIISHSDSQKVWYRWFKNSYDSLCIRTTITPLVNRHNRKGTLVV